MQSGSIPFIVYDLTGSATWVGIAGFVGFVPSMLATLPGGYFADRFSKGSFLACTQTLLALATLPLVFAAANGSLTMPLLLTCLGVQSALLGVSIASLQTVGPALVQKSFANKAINLNSGQAQVAKAVGPFVAGIVLAHFGAEWAFGVNALTFVFAALAMFTLRKLIPASHSRQRFEFQSTWRHPARRLLVILIGVAMFLGAPLYQSIALLASDRLHVGAMQYGLLVGLFGGGAVLGNVLRHHLRGRESQIITSALVLYGASIAIAGIASNVYLAAAAIAAAGCGYLVVSVSSMTAIQLVTPENLRGRVVAIYSFAYVGGVPLGNLVQGWLADRIGIVFTLALAGSLLIALAGYIRSNEILMHRLDGEIDLREEAVRGARALAD